MKKTAMVQEAVRKSETLIEALPYIKSFHNRFVVIKIGGSAQEDETVLRKVFTDVDFMLAVGMRPVVVYGGGKKISKAMGSTGRKPVFIQGQRVTDAETMAVVSRVLVDEVGGELLQILESCGGRGQLLNGRDHGFLRAIKKTLPDQPEMDLGFVGEPVAIDASDVFAIIESGRVPLVAPVACGCGPDSGSLYNINGDTAAALVARDLHAEKLVFMMDMPGICRDPADPASLLPHLTKAQVLELCAEGVIKEGMIPKVEACLYALEGGVKKAHIVPGGQAHALLLEIFTTKGVGTEIVL